MQAAVVPGRSGSTEVFFGPTPTPAVVPPASPAVVPTPIQPEIPAVPAVPAAPVDPVPTTPEVPVPATPSAPAGPQPNPPAPWAPGATAPRINYGLMADGSQPTVLQALGSARR